MSGYFTADISYVQFVKRFAEPAQFSDTEGIAAQQAYLAGSTAINWLSWMAGSLFGIFLTQFIPVQWGLGFAGFLALLGIALSLVTTQLRFLAASLSAVLAIGLIELPFNLNVLFGILISIAICDQLALYRSRAVDLKG